ncbi:MAG: PLP-dependent transferase, partial [Deltaproteobacteria bacterium]|nr:PLP-dependent transferase [Deltaproteobacteria bacterium]
ALISYWDLKPEQRRELGVPDSLVRLSCGIEDADDLIADLEQALESI